MIFTIGHTISYATAFREEPELLKLGRTDEHPGGGVWETRQAAQDFLDSMPNEYCPNWQAKDFSVYGVDADWEEDTYEDFFTPWRLLKRDAQLIKLSD